MIKNVTRIIEKSIGKIDVRYDMCISDGSLTVEYQEKYLQVL